MKVMSVDEDLYGALEAVADRDGRTVEELVAEAIASWLEESAVDQADHAAIESLASGDCARSRSAALRMLDGRVAEGGSFLSDCMS